MSRRIFPVADPNRRVCLLASLLNYHSLLALLSTNPIYGLTRNASVSANRREEGNNSRVFLKSGNHPVIVYKLKSNFYQKRSLSMTNLCGLFFDRPAQWRCQFRVFNPTNHSHRPTNVESSLVDPLLFTVADVSDWSDGCCWAMAFS